MLDYLSPYPYFLFFPMLLAPTLATLPPESYVMVEVPIYLLVK